MLKSVVLQLQTLGKSEVKEKKGKNQAIARQLNNRKCLFLLLGLSFLSFSLCISLSAGAVWAAPFRLLRSTFFLVVAFKRLSSSFLSQSFPVESRISVSFLFSKRIPPNFFSFSEERKEKRRESARERAPESARERERERERGEEGREERKERRGDVIVLSYSFFVFGWRRC